MKEDAENRYLRRYVALIREQIHDVKKRLENIEVLCDTLEREINNGINKENGE